MMTMMMVIMMKESFTPYYRTLPKYCSGLEVQIMHCVLSNPYLIAVRSGLDR